MIMLVARVSLASHAPARGTPMHSVDTVVRRKVQTMTVSTGATKVAADR